MKKDYQKTMYACFVGYIVQAIVNNFVPLLFLTFQSAYGIPLSKITFLVTFNFGLQLVIDFVSAGFIDKIGYRISIVAAHIFAAAGLVSLVILPDLFADPFTGLLIAVMIYALGGGLLEVLVSPIVEACPSDNKESAMSLLHSFYCWGHVGVVLLSTIFFTVFGIKNWKIAAACWAVIPFLNAIFFTRVPIANLIEEGETGLTIKELLMNKIFWLMVLLMVCAGASEQAVSQWASALAEKELGITKTLGDLLGPMVFAIMMGLSRTLYGRMGERIPIQKAILGSGVLCVASYLLISLSGLPALGLIGCGICGFSVGIFWPGVFSVSSAAIRRGGTMMFAFLALAGDLGCSMGPTVVGRISGLAGDNLKSGILAAVVFPVLLISGIAWQMLGEKRSFADSGK
ncbi:MAG: MFS transporter [Clostridiales bacterium]|nr:MFS transporter [Clostridiales bacterium]